MLTKRQHKQWRERQRIAKRWNSADHLRARQVRTCGARPGDVVTLRDGSRYKVSEYRGFREPVNGAPQHSGWRRG